NKNFKSLFTYFKKADRRNERLIKSFEVTAKQIQEVSQAQVDNLGGFEESVEELKNFTTSLLTEQEEVHAALADIKNENKELVNTMAAHNKTFKDIFGTELTSELSGIKTYLGDLNKGFDQVGQSIGTLPDALHVINQTHAENKTLLTDRLDDLKEFNRTFNNHLKKHTTESENFDRRMQEATSTFDQMAAKNNQLITDINKMVTKVNQNYNYRTRILATSVDELIIMLQRYIVNFICTLC